MRDGLVAGFPLAALGVILFSVPIYTYIVNFLIVPKWDS